jgi:hypothetical protein
VACGEQGQGFSAVASTRGLRASRQEQRGRETVVPTAMCFKSPSKGLRSDRFLAPAASLGKSAGRERFRGQLVEVREADDGRGMSTRTARVTWRKRAIAAEQLAAERLERISELLTKLREAAADLEEAKEQIAEDELDFAVKAAEIDFWVEECDYHRNKRLDKWANDARYRAEQERKSAPDKSVNGVGDALRSAIKDGIA